MQSESLHICFDIVIPPEFAHSAIREAINENPANRKLPTSPFEAAAIRSKLWRPGRTLRVCFLDGHPDVWRRVEPYAHQWSEYANITLDFVDDPIAEIRISFAYNGSWSAVGTDALVREYFKPHQPTMNFGWLHQGVAEKEYQRVVLHEFGHALGLIHEHQNPDGGICWDEQKVLRAYAGPPNYWDEATIRHNILDHYNVDQTQFTAFDPNSIMLYAFPAELTLDGRGTTSNFALSATDKTFIAQLYPRDTANSGA